SASSPLDRSPSPRRHGHRHDDAPIGVLKRGGCFIELLLTYCLRRNEWTPELLNCQEQESCSWSTPTTHHRTSALRSNLAKPYRTESVEESASVFNLDRTCALQVSHGGDHHLPKCRRLRRAEDRYEVRLLYEDGTPRLERRHHAGQRLPLVREPFHQPTSMD